MTQDEYNDAFDKGYKRGFESGMVAGHNHAVQHNVAALVEDAKAFNAAMDQRIDEFVLAFAPDSPGAKEIVARREAALYKALDDYFAEHEVYQGVNTLCAHCGQPVGDTPVRDQDDRANTYFYCSDRCWHAHEWEAS